MSDNITATIHGIDKIIAYLCLTAYKKANPRISNNPNRRHNPYSIPSDALDLIQLKEDLTTGAKTEAEAKTIMMTIRKNNQ